MSRFFALAATGLIVIAVSLALHVVQNAPSHDKAPLSAVAPSPAEKGQVVGGQVIPPSFDVVRVDSQGNAVFAGHASPSSSVVILEGGAEIGHIVADRRGEWVFVPDKPVAVGSRHLSLMARLEDGTIIHSSESLILALSDIQGDVLALKTSKDGSVVLKGFEGGERASLAVTAIDLDAKGKGMVTGQASPKADLMVYVDNKFTGRVSADIRGMWRFSLPRPIGLSRHRVRVDHIGKETRVMARAEVDFTPITIDNQPEDAVIVQDGRSLWRIADRTYGHGTMYRSIYKANGDQRRDPHKIYPGQILKLPAKDK